EADGGPVPQSDRDRPRARREILRTEGRDEPRPAVGRARPPQGSARTPRTHLRLVHRGLRYRRPEGSKGAARPVGLDRGWHNLLLGLGWWLLGGHGCGNQTLQSVFVVPWAFERVRKSDIGWIKAAGFLPRSACGERGL